MGKVLKTPEDLLLCLQSGKEYQNVRAWTSNNLSVFRTPNAFWRKAAKGWSWSGTWQSEKKAESNPIFATRKQAIAAAVHDASQYSVQADTNLHKQNSIYCIEGTPLCIQGLAGEWYVSFLFRQENYPTSEEDIDLFVWWSDVDLQYGYNYATRKEALEYFWSVFISSEKPKQHVWAWKET